MRRRTSCPEPLFPAKLPFEAVRHIQKLRRRQGGSLYKGLRDALLPFAFRMERRFADKNRSYRAVICVKG